MEQEVTYTATTVRTQENLENAPSLNSSLHTRPQASPTRKEGKEGPTPGHHPSLAVPQVDRVNQGLRTDSQ